MWTEFHDMASGGHEKTRWNIVYIEAPEEEAMIIFYNRFGHNPKRVTCTCCGPDYRIEKDESLEKLTASQRTHYEEKTPTDFPGLVAVREVEKYQTLDEFEKRDDVLIIRKEEIKDEERRGYVPLQGYVW